MESIEFLLVVLAVLTALLIVIVIYKMGMRRKNIDLLKEQLRKKRLEDEKGGAEFTTGASGMEAAPTPYGDKHFNPSG